jgi:hypothetical protein
MFGYRVLVETDGRSRTKGRRGFRVRLNFDIHSEESIGVWGFMLFSFTSIKPRKSME